MKIPDTFVERITQKQCIAFVGAGFSMPCNMPGWFDLIGWLIKEVERSQSDNTRKPLLESAHVLMSEGRLDDAADILIKIIPHADLHEYISKRFDRDNCKKAYVGSCGIKRMKKRLDNLLRIPWAGLITTNYDTLIDDWIPRQKKFYYKLYAPNAQNFGNIFLDFSNNKPFVKIHGSVDSGYYVLGTKSYEETYFSNPRISLFMQHVMLRFNLFFIGCSLEDEIFRLRADIMKKFYIYPPAYALLPDNEENRKRRKRLESEANIWPIYYDIESVKGEPTHMEVDRCLQSLYFETKK